MSAIGDVLISIRHADHDSHWHISTDDVNTSCLACLFDLLDDDSLVLVKKNIVLKELLRLLVYYTEQVKYILIANYKICLYLIPVMLGKYFAD